MKRTALALLALTLSLTCCSDHSYDPVTEVEFDDKDMNVAIDDARSSVAEFIERLKNPRPTDESFSVKKKDIRWQGGGAFVGHRCLVFRWEIHRDNQ